MFTCLYDLQKAYDSVEYAVLLDRLFEVGVNGRTWRLLRSWYDGAECQVKYGGSLSESFVVGRGVKQGSILSPTLFLMVMDPLLKALESSRLGLSVNNHFAGAFIHADDFRTLCTSMDTLNQQMSFVKQFTESNFLKLNVAKCEIVVFGSVRGKKEMTDLEMVVEDAVIPVSSEGKCLGYWWRGDLFAARSVEENIGKARRSFFHYGSIGVFQGDLSPLSSRSVIETCVIPVLLYGAENWIMTEQLVKRVDSFLGEMAKRAVKWPKHHSNTAALVVLDMESARARLLVMKLGFLRRRMMDDGVGVGAAMMSAMCDDVESTCLVRSVESWRRCWGRALLMRF